MWWRVGPRPGTPGPGRWARCCREAGGQPQAVTSEHYARPPLCWRRLSEEKTPLLFLPQQPGGAISPSRAWRSPAGPRWSPPGSPCHLTPCHPQNLGLNVYFLIRMPAMREPPRGPSVGVGALGRVPSTLSCPHLPLGGRRASQGRRVPQSRHCGSPTRRVWHFCVGFVDKLHPLAPSPHPNSRCQRPPHPKEARAYLFSE